MGKLYVVFSYSLKLNVSISGFGDNLCRNISVFLKEIFSRNLFGLIVTFMQFNIVYLQEEEEVADVAPEADAATGYQFNAAANVPQGGFAF